MGQRASIVILAAAACLGLRTAAATTLTDPPSVTIGNGPAQPDGSYLNAGNIADQLVFGNVSVSAGSTIIIADNIDLAQSPTYGSPTFYSLLLTSPTTNMSHNIKMGGGSLSLMASTVNLAGLATTASGFPLNSTRFSGTATQVNVLANTASLQQSVSIASSSTPATIAVAAGQYQGNLTVNKQVTLRGDRGDPAVAGAAATAPVIVGTTADGNVVAISSSNVTVEGFNISAQVQGGALNDSNNAITGSTANVTIDNNTFTGFDVNGIAATSSNNLNVHHNQFSDIGNDAINVNGGTGVVVNANLIRGTGSVVGAGRNGITITSCPGAAIDNNTIEGVAGGTGAANDGILLQTCNNAFLRNNTVRYEAGTGAVGAGHLPFEILTSNNVTSFGNQSGPFDPALPTEDGALPNPLRVARGTGSSLTLTYGVSCHAVEATVYWGEASGHMTGAIWTNAVCGFGTASTASVDPGTSPAGRLLYFVVVAGNGTKQGSYGRNSSGVERPAAAGLGACNLPQQLGGMCP